MPTASGAETIGERLTRYRADLTRVREAIARAENNGQASNIGGTQITEIAHERLQERETKLTGQIAALENRLGGGVGRPGTALTATRFDA